MTTQHKGLEMLRKPFPENHISKLPKPTRHQTDLVKQDFKNGIRCGVCGGWHHKDVIHLDYVGHAALTDRLLDCDPNWSWEPLAVNDSGLPAFDQNGGMWIKLTVCGVTRLGYGDAQGKSGGDAIKECIGDALRNAAMRFGAALDLWHKGDLHKDNGDCSDESSNYTEEQTLETQKDIKTLEKCRSIPELVKAWETIYPKHMGTPSIKQINEAKDSQKDKLKNTAVIDQVPAEEYGNDYAA